MNLFKRKDPVVTRLAKVELLDNIPSNNSETIKQIEDFLFKNHTDSTVQTLLDIFNTLDIQYPITLESTEDNILSCTCRTCDFTIKLTDFSSLRIHIRNTVWYYSNKANSSTPFGIHKKIVYPYTKNLMARRNLVLIFEYTKTGYHFTLTSEGSPSAADDLVSFEIEYPRFEQITRKLLVVNPNFDIEILNQHFRESIDIYRFFSNSFSLSREELAEIPYLCIKSNGTKVGFVNGKISTMLSKIGSNALSYNFINESWNYNMSNLSISYSKQNYIVNFDYDQDTLIKFNVLKNIFNYSKDWETFTKNLLNSNFNRLTVTIPKTDLIQFNLGEIIDDIEKQINSIKNVLN